MEQYITCCRVRWKLSLAEVRALWEEGVARSLQRSGRTAVRLTAGLVNRDRTPAGAARRFVPVRLTPAIDPLTVRGDRLVRASDVWRRAGRSTCPAARDHSPGDILLVIVVNVEANHLGAEVAAFRLGRADASTV